MELWLGTEVLMPRVLHNRISQNSVRRRLRQTMTEAEIVLWAQLKGRGFLGYKFRRQHGIGRYVLDFYCPKLRLAIELDGNHHRLPRQAAYDQQRDQWIKGCNIHIVRYPNDEILTDIEIVLEDLSRIMGRRSAIFDHLPQHHTE